MANRSIFVFRLILLTLPVVMLAACGGGAGTAPPPATPTAPAPTPGAHWRSDTPVGSSVGQRAPHAVALTLDGQVTSIEQLAGGKPVLVYFFASW